MAIRTYKVTLDSKNTIAPEPVFLRQGDKTGAVVIDATLLDNGSPVKLGGLSLSFKANTADGKAFIDDSSGFGIVSAEDGEFTYQVPSQLGQVPGKIKLAYFSLSDANGLESTFNVIFSVSPAADMTQASSKDWLSNLNDIISKYNDWIDDAHSSWEDFVNTNKKIIESVDPGGVVLSQITNALSSGTYGAYSDIDARFENIEKNVTKFDASNNVYLLGRLPNQSAINAVNTIKSSLDVGRFNAVMISDTHFANQSSTANMSNLYGVDHVNNALLLDGFADAIILGGDNIDGYHNAIDGLVSDERQISAEFVLGGIGSSDRFALKGNHDDGSIRLTDYRAGRRPEFTSVPPIISDETFRKDYLNSELLFGEVRNGDSDYLFKDYPSKKVRVICLNSNDNPEMLDTDGGAKYPGINIMGYRQDQLDWLANVALKNVPEDYTTIIFSHIDPSVDQYNSKIITGYDSHVNQGCVNSIIKDFIAGTSEEVTGSVTDWQADVKVNFSDQGPRKFAGYVHGHLHVETYTSNLGFNDIGVLASVGPKGTQTGDNDGWNVISIDPDNSKIILTGFGKATNREFKY